MTETFMDLLSKKSGGEPPQSQQDPTQGFLQSITSPDAQPRVRGGQDWLGSISTDEANQRSDALSAATTAQEASKPTENLSSLWGKMRQGEEQFFAEAKAIAEKVRQRKAQAAPSFLDIIARPKVEELQGFADGMSEAWKSLWSSMVDASAAIAYDAPAISLKIGERLAPQLARKMTAPTLPPGGDIGSEATKDAGKGVIDFIENRNLPRRDLPEIDMGNMLLDMGKSFREDYTPDRKNLRGWQRFITQSTPQAIGSALHFMVSGVVAGPYAIAANGIGQQMSAAFHDALAHGADEDTAIAASIYAIPGGASEVIPAADWANRLRVLNKLTGGGVGYVLRKLGTETVEEVGQELFQQLGANWTARVLEYDPDRSLTEGFGESAGAAAIVAILFGGATLAAERVGGGVAPADFNNALVKTGALGDAWESGDLAGVRGATVGRTGAPVEPRDVVVEVPADEGKAAGILAGTYPGKAVAETEDAILVKDPSSGAEAWAPRAWVREGAETPAEPAASTEAPRAPEGQDLGSVLGPRVSALAKKVASLEAEQRKSEEGMTPAQRRRSRQKFNREIGKERLKLQALTESEGRKRQRMIGDVVEVEGQRGYVIDVTGEGTKQRVKVEFEQGRVPSSDLDTNVPGEARDLSKLGPRRGVYNFARTSLLSRALQTPAQQQQQERRLEEMSEGGPVRFALSEQQALAQEEEGRAFYEAPYTQYTPNQWVGLKKAGLQSPRPSKPRDSKQREFGKYLADRGLGVEFVDGGKKAKGIAWIKDGVVFLDVNADADTMFRWVAYHETAHALRAEAPKIWKRNIYDKARTLDPDGWAESQKAVTEMYGDLEEEEYNDETASHFVESFGGYLDYLYRNPKALRDLYRKDRNFVQRIVDAVVKTLRRLGIAIPDRFERAARHIDQSKLSDRVPPAVAIELASSFKEALDALRATDAKGELRFAKEGRFYSGAVEAIKSFKANKFSAADAKNLLAKAPGVTTEELEDLGIDRFLTRKAARKEPITKEELLDVATSGEPKIEMHLLGPDIVDAPSDKLSELLSMESVLREQQGALENVFSKYGPSPIFGGYDHSAYSRFIRATSSPARDTAGNFYQGGSVYEGFVKVLGNAYIASGKPVYLEALRHLTLSPFDSVPSKRDELLPALDEYISELKKEESRQRSGFDAGLSLMLNRARALASSSGYDAEKTEEFANHRISQSRLQRASLALKTEALAVWSMAGGLGGRVMFNNSAGEAEKYTPGMSLAEWVARTIDDAYVDGLSRPFSIPEDRDDPALRRIAGLGSGGLTLKEVLEQSPDMQGALASLYSAIANRKEQEPRLLAEKAEVQALIKAREEEEGERAVLMGMYTRPKWKGYKLDGGRNYREIPFSIEMSGPAFRGGHYDDTAENVWAHLRFDERYFTTENAPIPGVKNMLFAQEVQSDLHQKGHDPEIGYGFGVDEAGERGNEAAEQEAREKLDELQGEENEAREEVRGELSEDVSGRFLHPGNDETYKTYLLSSASGQTFLSFISPEDAKYMAEPGFIPEAIAKEAYPGPRTEIEDKIELLRSAGERVYVRYIKLGAQWDWIDVSNDEDHPYPMGVGASEEDALNDALSQFNEWVERAGEDHDEASMFAKGLEKMKDWADFDQDENQELTIRSVERDRSDLEQAIDAWREKTSEREELETRIEYGDIEEFAGDGEGEGDVIPDAPLKESWMAYVMKQLLMLAVDSGFDAIGWSHSSLHIERYNDPSKWFFMSRLEWYGVTDDTDAYIVATSTGGVRATVHFDYESGEIRDSSRGGGDDKYIGKHLSSLIGTKLANHVMEKFSGDPESSGEINNDDPGVDQDMFTFGGQGFVKSYDERLSAIVKRLIKKYKGEVKLVELPHSAAHRPSGRPAKSWVAVINEDARKAIKEKGFTRYGERFAKIPVRRLGRNDLLPRKRIHFSRAFWEWFGDSKIVADDGMPKVMLHGSLSEFNIFRPGRVNGAFGRSIYMSNMILDVEQNYVNPNSPDWRAKVDDLADTIFNDVENGDMETDGPFGYEDAVAMAEKMLHESKPNVKPVYVRITNPLEVGEESTSLKLRDIEHAIRAIHADGELIFDADELIEAIIPPFDNSGKISASALYDAMRYVDASLEGDEGPPANGELFRQIAERLGHDGIIADAESMFGFLPGVGVGTRHVMAFKPSQVKSAIGNRGTYSADDPDVRFTIAKPKVYRTSKSKERREGNVDKIARYTAEYMRSWQAIDDDGQLPENVAVHLHHDLRRGRSKARMQALQTGYVDKILKILSGAGIHLDEFNELLYARHAEERNEYISSIDPSILYGSGMSNDEANEILAKWEADPRGAEAVRAADLFDLMNRSILRDAMRDGLLSNAQVWGMVSKWKHYAPLKHIDPEDGPSMGTGKGSDIRGREFKQAFGRGTKATDLFEQAVSQGIKEIVRGEKNKVGIAVLKYVKNNPDMGVINYPELRKVIGADGMVRMMHDPTYKLSDNVFSLKKAGREYHVTFFPEYMDFVQGLKGMDTVQQGKFLSTMRRYVRWLAAMVTRHNPFFAPFNAIRDAQHAGLVLAAEAGLPFSMKALMHIPLAWKAMFAEWGNPGGETSDPMRLSLREYQEAGAPVTFLDLGSVEQLSKDMHAKLRDAKRGVAGAALGYGRMMRDGIDGLNDLFENGSRLASYYMRRKQGWSVKRSAQYAKRLTVNFEQKGAKTETINTLYMFAQAGMSGMARVLIPIVKGHKGMQRVALGVAAMGFMYELLNYYSADDDEYGRNQYLKQDKWKRDTNVMIPLGGGDYFSFPTPYVFQFFWNFGRNAAGAVGGYMTPAESAVATGVSFLDNFNPLGGAENIVSAVTPTPADPWVELISNTDWGNRMIYKPAAWRGDKSAAESGWERTSPFWKEIAQAMERVTRSDAASIGWADTPPEALEHLFQAHIGSAGAEAMRVIGIGMKSAMDEEITYHDIPVVRRVYSPESFWSNRALFKDLTDKVATAKARASALRSSGDPTAERAYRERAKPWMDLSGLAGALERQARRTKDPEALAKIYGQLIKRAKETGAIGPAE